MWLGLEQADDYRIEAGVICCHPILRVTHGMTSPLLRVTPSLACTSCTLVVMPIKTTKIHRKVLQSIIELAPITSAQTQDGFLTRDKTGWPCPVWQE